MYVVFRVSGVEDCTAHRDHEVSFTADRLTWKDFDDRTYTATLQGRDLVWSDGDRWVRVLRRDDRTHVLSSIALCWNLQNVLLETRRCLEKFSLRYEVSF